MRKQDVERLIARYLEGQTLPEEEKRLALELDRAIERGDAPQEWRVVAAMLGELTLGEALYDKMIAERRRKRIGVWTVLTAAASVALLLIYVAVSHADMGGDAMKMVAKKEVRVQQAEEKEYNMEKKEEQAEENEYNVEEKEEQVAEKEYNVEKKEEKVEEKEDKEMLVEEEVRMIAEAKPIQKPRQMVVVAAVAEEIITSEDVVSITEEMTAEEDVPVVQEVAEETSTTDEIDIEELRRKYRKEIAQVEHNYYEWEKKRSASLYKTEMNAVGEKTEQQYVKYIKKDNNV